MSRYRIVKGCPDKVFFYAEKYLKRHGYKPHYWHDRRPKLLKAGTTKEAYAETKRLHLSSGAITIRAYFKEDLLEIVEEGREECWPLTLGLVEEIKEVSTMSKYRLVRSLPDGVFIHRYSGVDTILKAVCYLDASKEAFERGLRVQGRCFICHTEESLVKLAETGNKIPLTWGLVEEIKPLEKEPTPEEALLSLKADPDCSKDSQGRKRLISIVATSAECALQWALYYKDEYIDFFRFIEGEKAICTVASVARRYDNLVLSYCSPIAYDAWNAAYRPSILRCRASRVTRAGKEKVNLCQQRDDEGIAALGPLPETEKPVEKPRYTFSLKRIHLGTVAAMGERWL